MSVLLEHDSNRPLQSHLDELTWRTTVVFATVALFTLAWSFYVDTFLGNLLRTLQPCVGDCLNVYDPAQWSAVRWLTSLMLAVFSSVPLILFQLLRFSKPGLLPTEYQALKRWLGTTTLLLLVGSVLMMREILPQLYQFGFEQHDQVGLAAQYSAVDMLLVAAFCMWSFLVVVATWNALAVMGLFGVLNAQTADYWRLRIYGSGSLLLVLSTPDHASPVLLPMLATYWTSSELIGQRWLHKTPAAYGTPAVRLDAQGRRRSVAMVDCSCEGANTHHGHADVPGCSTVSVSSLCTNPVSRTNLLEHVIQSGITDVVITGCDGTPCPGAFRQNLRKLDVTVHGLNLMSLQNLRVRSPHPERDVRSAFYSIPSMFSSNVRDSLLLKLVEEEAWLDGDIHRLTDEDMGEWGDYHPEQRVLVPPCQTTVPQSIH